MKEKTFITIERILFLGLPKKEGMTTEDYGLAMAFDLFRLQHGHKPQTEEEQQEAVLFYFHWIEREISKVRRLPRRLRKGITDETAYALGVLTEEQREQLQAYYTKKTKKAAKKLCDLNPSYRAER